MKISHLIRASDLIVLGFSHKRLIVLADLAALEGPIMPYHGSLDFRNFRHYYL
jgi:hypothetical protein